MLTCEWCGKENQRERWTTCSYECELEAAKKNGSKIITPNNLPVTCWRGDTLLEHEHADHPTYMFPVIMEYFGEIPELEEYDQWSYQPQSHALIYTDGCIAVTLYECVFAVVYLRNNKVEHGSLWKNEKWRLKEESLKKVLASSPREKAEL